MLWHAYFTDPSKQIMHYLFQRRLNMVDVALNEMKDEEVNDENTAQKLLEENRIVIPDLEWNKAKYEVKKERLTSENAPPEFTVRHGHDYYYMICQIPFSDDNFISDIFKLTAVPEGLSIKPKEIEYREYSHDEIPEKGPEYHRIVANSRKAAEVVEMQLDEFAADAVEFNQVFLPVGIAQKLAAERTRRALHQDRKAAKDANKA